MIKKYQNKKRRQDKMSALTLHEVIEFIQKRDVWLVAAGKVSIQDSGYFDKLRYEVLDLIANEHSTNISNVLRHLSRDITLSEDVYAKFIQLQEWLLESSVLV